ncbi:MAG: hypothetical protein MZU84_02320 [Sphingobacterium sp.]|nr:hypothetical protein [Sphingobacterium sp.]
MLRHRGKRAGRSRSRNSRSSEIIGYAIARNSGGWLTTSAAGGSTPGSFTLTTASNSGSPRTAKVVITAISPASAANATDTLTVTQSGEPPDLELDEPGTFGFNLEYPGLRRELFDGKKLRLESQPPGILTQFYLSMDATIDTTDIPLGAPTGL